jgi:N-acetylmuramoyl-L-alanine amidase
VAENKATAESRVKSRDKNFSIDTIIIDAGHGGTRKQGGIGGIGTLGTQEKIITLDLAEQVSKYIKKMAKVKVKLTRTKDEFMTLQKRVDFANKNRGDIFISIHANSAPHLPKVKGLETFILKSKVKSTSLAKRTSNRNLTVNNKPFYIRNRRILNIIEDLRTNRFEKESMNLAQTVHNQLIKNLRLKDRGIKKHNWYVVRWTRMPAILIEVGFLSNLEEEIKLQNRFYRKRLAKSIARGIINYKKQFEKLNRK